MITVTFPSPVRPDMRALGVSIRPILPPEVPWELDYSDVDQLVLLFWGGRLSDVDTVDIQAVVDAAQPETRGTRIIQPLIDDTRFLALVRYIGQLHLKTEEQVLDEIRVLMDSTS